LGCGFDVLGCGCGLWPFSSYSGPLGSGAPPWPPAKSQRSATVLAVLVPQGTPASTPLARTPATPAVPAVTATASTNSAALPGTWRAPSRPGVEPVPGATSSTARRHAAP